MSQPSIRLYQRLWLLWWRSSTEHIIGVRVSATKPDTSTAPASASANSMNRRPVRPVANASGAYTVTRVMVMATTAKPISREPRSAASLRGMPSSMWR